MNSFDGPDIFEIMQPSVSQHLEEGQCHSDVNVLLLRAGNVWMLSFEVKFYPSDPSQLTDEQSRFVVSSPASVNCMNQPDKVHWNCVFL